MCRLGNRRRGRGSRDASIVDKHIQTTQLLLNILKKCVQIRWLADVAYSSTDRRVLIRDFVHGSCVNVGDVHTSVTGDEGLGNGQSDSACAGGDEYALCYDWILLSCM